MSLDLIRHIRRWWNPPRIDPNAPHAFTAMDPYEGGGAGALSGRREGGLAAAVFAAEADAERGLCRVPGCNRPADDPIHA